MSLSTKKNIIFYHESCLDGFAAAYIAWKKFKDRAEYIPLSHTATGENILKSKKIKISDLQDKEVYFIDFCLKKVELEKVINLAKKVVVLDHHLSAQELVESLEGSVFRDGVSGAYLASEYFFPQEKISKFIQYISIGDTYTWRNEKLEKEILAYLHTLVFDFKVFVKAEKDLADKKKFLEISQLGKLLQENYLKLVDNQLKKATLIDFAGHKVYAINASSVFRNELGHRLSQESKSKFALIYTFENGELKISLRGDKKTDLNKLAQKYQGGGHFNAAAIRSKDSKFIFDFIKKVSAQD